jgi:hypothetical protein
MFWEIFRQKFLQGSQQSFSTKVGGMFWEIFRRIFVEGGLQKLAPEIFLEQPHDFYIVI